MANPTVIFERATGANGNSASGAGPVVATLGTTARSLPFGGGGLARVGFFEDTAHQVDLSLVATDGSHLVKLGTGSGRQWSRITAKKDLSVPAPEDTLNGNMTSGSAVLTVATAGINANDILSVAGAGAAGADLYATVNTVTDSTHCTLSVNAGTSVTSHQVICPKQISIVDSLTISSDTAWAIGGKRKDIDGITQFWADIQPGWTVELQDNGGEDSDVFPVTAQIVIDWSQNIEGLTFPTDQVNFVGTGRFRPRVSWDGSHVPFAVRSSLVRFKGIGSHTTTKSLAIVDSSLAQDVVFEDCSGSAGTYFVEITSAFASSRITFLGCDIRTEVRLGAGSGSISFERCLFRAAAHNTGTAIKTTDTFGADLDIVSCVFYDWSDAVNNLRDSFLSARMRVIGSVFDSNGRGLVAAASSEAWIGAVVRGNSFSNNSGNAVEGNASFGDLVTAQIDFNNFYQNGTDRVNISAGAHDTSLNPSFRSPASGDFSSSLSVRGLGDHPFLVDGIERVCPQSIDIGIQQAEPVGGNILNRILSVNEDPSNFFVQYVTVEGSKAGLVNAVAVPKSGIPVSDIPFTPSIVTAVQAFLRNNSSSGLIGRELRA